jgi:hypothetical protein
MVVPADPRARWIGLGVIVGAALFAFVVTVGIFVPALGQLGSDGEPIRADALPELLLVCGREYVRATDVAPAGLDDVRARDGRDPTVITRLDGCPDGVCLDRGLCMGTVYVLDAEGRYVAFVLDEGS